MLNAFSSSHAPGKLHWVCNYPGGGIPKLWSTA